MLTTLTCPINRPMVDGQPVGDGYGVVIEGERELPTLHLPSPTNPRPEWPLIAWLTKRNSYGEYKKVHQIDPAATITGIDEQSRSIHFEDGRLTITEVRSPSER